MTGESRLSRVSPMTGTILVPDALSAEQRGEMLALMRRHFRGVGGERFRRDLSEKSHVLLLEDEGGRLRGFSTMLCYEATLRGERLRIVYSGDTIVDPVAWRSSALARTWIGAVDELRAGGDPGVRWFWLLITSGFRTYRFLPVFWREFWPRHGRAMPPELRVLRDELARERFGDCYDPETGIVRFGEPQELRDELGRIEAGRLGDPDIAFFLERNPGHAAGDELVCLCELSDHNLTAAGRRVVSRVREKGTEYSLGSSKRQQAPPS